MRWFSFLLFFIFHNGFGQTDSVKHYHDYWFKKLGFKCSYVYNNCNGFEIGFVKYPTYLFNVEDESSYNPFVSSDFLFKNSKILYQPKIGCEYQFFFGGYKLSLADLTDFKNHSLRIIPEIDIGFFGLIYFAYGYSFGVTNNDKFPNMNHRFSFNLSIPLSWRN